jgi:hypothetical protein
MDRKEELRRLYIEEHRSLRDVADLLSTSPQTIRRQLIKFAIPRRCKNSEPKSWQTKEWLHQKYVVEERSTIDIAELVGANSRTVNFTLKKFGIERRQAGGHLKGKKMSAQSRAKMSEAKRGKNVGVDNPNWKGGKIPESLRERRSYIARKWRRLVLERDDHTCQICGSKQRLHVHHLKPFKDHPERRWDVKNGLSVCVFCHEKIHSRTFPDWLTGREPDANSPIEPVEISTPELLRISKHELQSHYDTMTIEQIAEMLGFNAETVRKKMIELDIQRRPRGPGPSFELGKSTLEKLYAHHTLREIAQLLNVGETLIFKRMQRYGIKTRSPGCRPPKASMK